MIENHNDLLHVMEYDPLELNQYSLVILANPIIGNSDVISETYRHVESLCMKINDGRFYLPGYQDADSNLSTEFYREIQFDNGRRTFFNQQAFYQTVAWIESEGYEYSGGAELLFLEYIGPDSRMLPSSDPTRGFDLKNIVGFSLDEIAGKRRNLAYFLRDCRNVARGSKNISSLMSTYGSYRITLNFDTGTAESDQTENDECREIDGTELIISKVMSEYRPAEGTGKKTPILFTFSTSPNRWKADYVLKPTRWEDRGYYIYYTLIENNYETGCPDTIAGIRIVVKGQDLRAQNVLEGIVGEKLWTQLPPECVGVLVDRSIERFGKFAEEHPMEGRAIAAALRIPIGEHIGYIEGFEGDPCFEKAALRDTTISEYIRRTKHLEGVLYGEKTSGPTAPTNSPIRAKPQKKRIFISYKRVDLDAVTPIKNRIEAATGQQCWIDLDGIESDAQFKQVIIKAIDECEVLLFMYSKQHSLITDYENDWTIKELGYASRKKKRVVLVNLDGTPLTGIFDFDYGSKQQVDACNESALSRLCLDLCSWLK